MSTLINALLATISNDVTAHRAAEAIADVAEHFGLTMITIDCSDDLREIMAQHLVRRGIDLA